MNAPMEANLNAHLEALVLLAIAACEFSGEEKAREECLECSSLEYCRPYDIEFFDL